MPEPASPIRGLFFDLDGTLTRPLIDFQALRRDLGLQPTDPILEVLQERPEPERSEKLARLHEIENEAAMQTTPNAGFAPFAEWLAAWREEDARRQVAVVTRNFREAALLSLTILGLAVDALVAREDSRPKPEPDAIYLAMDRTNVTATETVFVGDFLYDMQAGRAAGVRTVYLANHTPPRPDIAALADATFTTLAALPEWVTAQGA